MKDEINKQSLLEERLAFEIKMMMAGSIDSWKLDIDNDVARALAYSAKLTAEGIARKLVGSIERNEELNAQTWKRMADDATRNAFIEVEGMPMVKLGEKPVFAECVAECTALVVAPPGSAWARAVERRMEDGMRAELESRGVAAHDIERVVRDMRAARLKQLA